MKFNPIRNISDWRAYKYDNFVIMLGIRVRGTMNTYILLQEAIDKIADAKRYGGTVYPTKPIQSVRSNAPAVIVSFTLKFNDKNSIKKFLARWSEN